MSISQETRRESHAMMDKAKRRAEIVAVLERTAEPLTAREIAHLCGYGNNRQATAPRLTEMRDAGIVTEASKKRDPITDRPATAYSLANKKAPAEAGTFDKGACKNTLHTKYTNEGDLSNA